MQKIKCFFGVCHYARPKFCERICVHCRKRWVFSEIDHPRMRTGTWFYMGKASAAALARVQP